jgi:hypothetical protein
MRERRHRTRRHNGRRADRGNRRIEPRRRSNSSEAVWPRWRVRQPHTHPRVLTDRGDGRSPVYDLLSLLHERDSRIWKSSPGVRLRLEPGQSIPRMTIAIAVAHCVVTASNGSTGSRRAPTQPRHSDGTSVRGSLRRREVSPPRRRAHARTADCFGDGRTPTTEPIDRESTNVPARQTSTEIALPTSSASAQP